MRLFYFALYTLVFKTLSPLAIAQQLNYKQQTFTFPASTEQLVIANINGDNLSDIITVVDSNLRVYFQRDSGFDFLKGFDEINFEDSSVGWELSTDFSSNGKASILGLVNGTDVYSWQAVGETIGQPKLIKSGLSGFLSKGINRLFFSRDINGDGNEDFIIPGSGSLAVYLANDYNDFNEPMTVATNNRIRTSLQTNELERQVGQRVRIPLMEVRDVNNDGSNDLISRTEEKLDVFIADKQNQLPFKASPSYSVDITEIEERLGEFDIDNLDFSNLTGVLALTHEELLEDVNGDQVDDLILREGGKVSLFKGTSDGMEFEKPLQVLRSGGNVLSTFLYDENEDGLKDLWLWRVEPVSVGDIFLWLALSGSIAIEAFIYPNDGERFSRRPSRKLTVNLRFPSVIRLATSFQELARDARENQNEEIIPSKVGNLDGEIEKEDILILTKNQLQMFLNVIEPEPEGSPFLGSLNYTRSRDNYEIDFREIISNIAVSKNPLIEKVTEDEADLSIALNTNVNNGDVVPVLLNADTLDDIFIFTDYDGSNINGILLLSQ